MQMYGNVVFDFPLNFVHSLGLHDSDPSKDTWLVHIKDNNTNITNV